ncbi:MAG TPA: c-type cytochrome [Pseudobdellovibrionaceae bacterium]|jgi:nitric oxide reductase subunit C
MLSKSAAKSFFLIGTAVCGGAFVLLTLDTIKQVPARTNEENITVSVHRGKDLWDKSNCMGCHTLLGEGAYYAPELTKVFQRRGADFIKKMLQDPESMYPGQRKMQKYNFTEEEREDLVSFLKWVGEIDSNGFPAKPPLAVAMTLPHPVIFDQMCIACHSLGGRGGQVGPALDGVGSRRDKAFLMAWLKDPTQIKADSKMPKLPLQDLDIQALADFLSQNK